jgi:hypothetical protein
MAPMETWQSRRRRWAQRQEQRIEQLRKVLRRPGAKLVLENRKHGHQFVVEPGGLKVSDTEAEVLIRRRLVRVHDPGLFDTPQSWTCN